MLVPVSTSHYHAILPILISITVTRCMAYTIATTDYNYNLRDYRICNLVDQEVMLEFRHPQSENDELYDVATTTTPILLVEDIKGLIHDAIVTNTNNYTDTVMEISNNTGIPAGGVSINWSKDDSSRRVLGRQCGCATNHYCLGGNYCGIYRYTIRPSEGQPVVCLDFSMKMAFIKNTWPVIILWYIALLFLFVLSSTGRQVRLFIRSVCNASLTQRMVDDVWRQEMEMRHEAALFQQERHERRAGTENENVLRANEELVLKYKRYHVVTTTTLKMDEESDCIHPNSNLEAQNSDINTLSDDTTNNNSTIATAPAIPESDEDSLEEKEEVVCTICMIELNEGDRIGALSCNHSFHVHCLKQWLTRRNVCPLCLTPDIASARPTTSTPASINTTNATIRHRQGYNNTADNNPSLLVLASQNHTHRGIAAGSVNLIAHTLLTLDAVTANLQNHFFGAHATATNGDEDHLENV